MGGYAGLGGAAAAGMAAAGGLSAVSGDGQLTTAGQLAGLSNANNMTQISQLSNPNALLNNFSSLSGNGLTNVSVANAQAAATNLQTAAGINFNSLNTNNFINSGLNNNASALG